MPFGNLFSSKEQTTSTQQLTPWGPAAAGLQTVAQDVSRAAGRPLQFFPGQTYAPQTAAEQQAIQALMGGAQQFGAQVMPAMGRALAAPDVAANPYVTGMAEAMRGQLGRQLTETVLPNLTLGAVGYGGLGGTRQQLGEAQAVGRSQQALAEGLAGLYGGAYGQGLQAQQAAMQMAPSLFRGQAGLLAEAGGMERAEAQRAIDEERARFEFAQQEPFIRAGMVREQLMPMATSFGRQTGTTTSVSDPSTFQKIGGLMSLAGGIGSMFTPMGPAMMGLGALGGMGGMGGMGLPMGMGGGMAGYA